MQMICGMHRSAYWLANFLVDLIKMEIIVAVTIACFFGFSLKYYTAWVTYLVFPFAAIPWIYVMSFVFSTVSAAQTGTMFLNFGFCLFGSTLVFYLRWIPLYEKVADGLHAFMRIVPAYTLGQSIHFDSGMGPLAEFRENTGKGADNSNAEYSPINGTGLNLKVDPWLTENVLGDIISLGIHFVFWWMLVLIIEMGLAKKLN